MNQARKYTNRLLDMLAEGSISNEKVVEMTLGYMSEADVQDMMETNELLVDQDED